MKSVYMAAVAALGISCIAHAEDDTIKSCGCDRLIANGIYSAKSNRSESDYHEYAFSFFCSADVSVAVDALKTQYKLGLDMLETLGLNFDASMPTESLNEWRIRGCSTDSRVVSLLELKEKYERIGKHDDIEAANECFAACSDVSGGLVCDISNIDDHYSIFTVNWSQSLQAKETRFPKIMGGELIGAEVLSENYSILASLYKGQEIRRTGIAVILKRTDSDQPIRLKLQTDSGDCSEISNIQNVKYFISAEIWATGNKVIPVSRQFSYAFGNSNSCTEGWREIAHKACIDGTRVTDIQGPDIKSQRHTGRTWAEKDPNNPACALLHYGYSDEGRSLFGDCRGNGWIEAGWTIVGYKEIPTKTDVFRDNRHVSISRSDLSSQVFSPSVLDETINNASWQYKVVVKRVVGDQNEAIYELGPKNSVISEVTTTQKTNGSVVVNIKPRDILHE